MVWNAFANRFKAPRPGKERRRRDRTAGRDRGGRLGGLGGESLESRAMLAAFTYDSVADSLTIDLDNANEAITLTSSGAGDYVFTSTSNFTGTDIASELSGNGSTTLNITSTLPLSSVLITDSATGTSVSFGTSSDSYVDNFSIALDNTPGNVTVAQSTVFAGSSTLSALAKTLS